MAFDQRAGERRYRVYWLSWSWVLDSFRTAGQRWPQQMVVPIAANVPDGAFIEQVRENPEAKTFDFYVEHESFAPVPYGERCPRMAMAAEREVVELTGEGEGPLVRHLQTQLKQLRELFDDLRLDSPPVDAAYRRGLSDAADFVRKGDVSGVLTEVEASEIAIASGANAVFAAALRLLASRGV